MKDGSYEQIGDSAPSTLSLDLHKQCMMWNRAARRMLDDSTDWKSGTIAQPRAGKDHD